MKVAGGNTAMSLKTAAQGDVRNLYAAAAIASALIVFTPSMAFADGALNGILNNIATLAGVVIGMVGVVFTVKFIIDYYKGSGSSIGKIVVSVLVLLFGVGLVTVFANIEALQGTFGGIAQSAVDTAADVTNQALG